MQINVGFCINDVYSRHLGVLIASILSHASEEDTYKFFIVSGFISDENKAKFEDLKKIKDFEVEYITVKEEDFSYIRSNKKVHASQFYRIVLFKLESIDKILYMDSDTICLHDLRELYEIDMGDYAIAGAEDILGRRMKQKYNLAAGTTYINSGVMLLNLKETRDIDIFAIIDNLPEAFRAGDFGDQDVLNYAFQEKILPIDIKWNYCYPFATTYFDVEYYLSLNKDPYIVHWITDIKPWTPCLRTPHKQEEYFKYLKMTQWNDTEFYFDYLMRGNITILQSMQVLFEHFKIPY